ncbi:MAG: hypothetical protein HF962_03365 [Sulfurovum sp.]|nr:hypothetical protein [Sulfurovum sp.]
MHFKKTITYSTVAVMVLLGCATENKYKAQECPECIIPVDNPGNGGGNDDNQTIIATIDYVDSGSIISWSKQHADEQSQGLAFSSNTIAAYTKWDNRLILIDPSTNSINSEKVFLDVTGGRYSSGEIPVVDSVSGASEQILTKVLLNSSATEVFSMIKKFDDNSRDVGIGIYRDSIANGVPDVRFARRATTDDSYYHYPKVTDIALSHDNTKLVTCGYDRKIAIFDPSSLNTPEVIDTGKKMRSVDFSANSDYIFAGSGGLSSLIRIYNTASKSMIAEIATAQTTREVKEIPEGNKMIAIFDPKNGVGGDILRVYDISDIGSPTQEKILIVNGNAKSIAISPDKKTFAIVATGNQVNLFAIDGGDNPVVINLGEPVSDAVFISETKLAVLLGTKIKIFDITVTR